MNAAKIATLIVILSLAGIAHGGESDRAKEQRWEAQIVDALFVGEPVKLQSGGQPFLALHAEPASGEVKGGVVLIHGIGVHPAWPDVIQPLRVNLPEHGWHTLSLQMPILANDVGSEHYPPLFDDAAARIEAGIGYFRERGVAPVAIVAHSLGSSMASWYLANNPDAEVAGFAGIGMGYNPADPKLDNAASLARITLPVLDLYGAQDLPAVLEQAEARAAAADRAGNTAYRQTRVEGADHFFRGAEDTLAKRVRGWLQQLTTSK